MAVPYILTGRPCSGKTTLAAWLCRRLPQPVAGLRTLCTGRCEAGSDHRADGSHQPGGKRPDVRDSPDL